MPNSNYLTQEIGFPVISETKDFLDFEYIDIPDEIVMAYDEFVKRHDYPLPLLRTDCNNLYITKSGIIYDMWFKKVITPIVKFDSEGHPIGLYFHPPKKPQVTIDIAELIVEREFRINPENVRINTTIVLDSVHNIIFFSKISITYKEPSVISFGTRDPGFTAMKFGNEYLVSRDNRDYYGYHGCVYLASMQKFLPVYIKGYYSRLDDGGILRATVYPFNKPVVLVENQLYAWTGKSLPMRASICMTNGLSYDSSLDHFSVIDMSLRNLNPMRCNRDKLQIAHQRIRHLNELCERRIQNTLKAIKRADKDR